MKNKADIKNGWSLETIYEIIGDLVCFEFILKIKTLIKDVEVKSYLAQFLKLLAPMYAYEIANSLQNLGVMNKSDFFNPGMDKKIQAERMKAIKHIIVNSSKNEEVTQEMGLNFNSKVYDINIILRNNELLGMNYEDFMDKINEEDYAFWESLFDFPRRTLASFMTSLKIDINLSDVFEKNSELLSQSASKVESELLCSRYAYSAHSLFLNSNNLDITDKVFALYRYRMISSVNNIEAAFPSFSISVGDDCTISLTKFFRKYKALIIEIIGEELKNMDTVFSNNIKSSLDAHITNKKFWTLNRTLRNNLHYVKTQSLTQDELKVVDQYQPIYLSIINTHILKELNIKVDKECITMTNFLKACQRKGLSKTDIEKYYYFYYVKFLITGRV